VTNERDDVSDACLSACVRTEPKCVRVCVCTGTLERLAGTITRAVLPSLLVPVASRLGEERATSEQIMLPNSCVCVCSGGLAFVSHTMGVVNVALYRVSLSLPSVREPLGQYMTP
jgi:hypothetical protein